MWKLPIHFIVVRDTEADTQAGLSSGSRKKSLKHLMASLHHCFAKMRRWKHLGTLLSLVGVSTFAFSTSDKPLAPSELVIDGQADNVRVLDDHRLVLKGRAQVKRGRLGVRGEQLEYDQDTDEARADGKVVITRKDFVVKGPSACIKLEANEGNIAQPQYWFAPTNGSGAADKIDFVGPGRYVAKNATYSTCSPENRSWFLHADRFDIDDNNKVATAKNSVLYFFDIPVFASPYLTLPLSDERRSGLLAPTFELNTNSGVGVGVPYYFNIAPNRDFTLLPRLMSKRGVQLGGEFRYLEPNYNGNVQVEYLPNDLILQHDRWFYRLQHQQNLPGVLPGLSLYADVAKVSDATYPSDLGQNVGTVVQQQFNQEVGVKYDIGHWRTFARVQKFQTLEPNVPPFNRVPQLNLQYNDTSLTDFVFRVEADATSFEMPSTSLSTMPNGQRAFIKPELSYVYRMPGYFVIPKISFDASIYDLQKPLNVAGPTRIERSVPTISVDSGLVFERPAFEWTHLLGVPITQTLEPRAFYVYTPFREQSQIPIFDSASTDFNLTKIFSEQSFSGHDRIADNSKVTLGITSRLLEENTGAERAQFVLAQRFDLDGQRVTMGSTNTAAQSSYSDLLVGASVRLLPKVTLESAVDYNMQASQLQSSSLDMSWRPSSSHTFNFGYRYQRPNDVLGQLPMRQFLTSVQWPITSKLYMIGRANYDRANHQMVDSLAGFEYDADCWIGRFALQRYATTPGSATIKTMASSFVFQIEFKGLSKVGASAGNIFKVKIPGYTPLSSRPVGTTLYDKDLN